jgi:hypothetical protein
MVRHAGQGAEVVEGTTKSGKPRVIDLDTGTAAVLKAHRKARGSQALQLARDDALVFGDLEGQHRNPEHVRASSPATSCAAGGARPGRAAGDEAS